VRGSAAHGQICFDDLTTVRWDEHIVGAVQVVPGGFGRPVAVQCHVFSQRTFLYAFLLEKQWKYGAELHYGYQQTISTRCIEVLAMHASDRNEPRHIDNSFFAPANTLNYLVWYVVCLENHLKKKYLKPQHPFWWCQYLTNGGSIKIAIDTKTDILE
jgi:hypothetical protein